MLWLLLLCTADRAPFPAVDFDIHLSLPLLLLVYLIETVHAYQIMSMKIQM